MQLEHIRTTLESAAAALLLAAEYDAKNRNRMRRVAAELQTLAAERDAEPRPRAPAPPRAVGSNTS